MDDLSEMRLLVVDDNATNVSLLEQILACAGYVDVRSTQDPTIVGALCREHEADLVLLDLHMPQLSGYEVLAGLSDLIAEPCSLPVLVLTADATREACHRALSMGARDFLNKPIDQKELLLRVGNLLHARQLKQRLERRNLQLDEAVRERTEELEQARLESLTVLAIVGEYHDSSTFHHTQRVGVTAALIAESLGLPQQFTATLRDAAPLHDVGKVGISDLILAKPGHLSLQERKAMMNHVEIGARMLEPARSPVLRLAGEIALTHHERWDGAGYLRGLAREQIPISGRITAVADVFDALTHERAYKPRWKLDQALAEINEQAGGQFDPRVVEAFNAIDPTSAPQPAQADTGTPLPG